MIKSGQYWSFDEETGKLEVKEGILSIEGDRQKGIWLKNKESIEWIGAIDQYIKSIKFPTSMEIIKPFSFAYCNNLENIVFSKGFSNIDREPLYICRRAFMCCSSLKKIKFNNSRSVSISDEAFELCENLKEVQLPKKLEFLGNQTFQECRNLEKIYIYQSITKKIPDVSVLATTNNNARVAVVGDDFELLYEDEEEFEESSTTSNEVAEIQTISKIQMSKSYCGVIRPNLLAKRNDNKNSNGKSH